MRSPCALCITCAPAAHNAQQTALVYAAQHYSLVSEMALLQQQQREFKANTCLHGLLRVRAAIAGLLLSGCRAGRCPPLRAPPH